MSTKVESQFEGESKLGRGDGSRAAGSGKDHLFCKDAAERVINVWKIFHQLEELTRMVDVSVGCAMHMANDECMDQSRRH